MSARLLRLALRAYPAGYREAHGDELAATALELGAASRRARASELLGLVAGGVRERGVQATGGRASLAWADGLRFAALALLLACAGVNLLQPAWDLAARAGVAWRPVADPFLGAHGWLRFGVAAGLPLAAAWALCRGRLLWCAALSFTAAAAFALGHLPFEALEYQSTGGIDPSGVLRAYRLGDAIFLAAPGVLALAACRPGRPAPRLSPWWLVLPLLQGVLLTHFWLTSTTFWPAGLLVLGWLAAARADLRLGVAAFATALPAALVLAPTAVADPRWEYAVLVTVGAAACAAVALSRVLDPDGT